jgi:hypothetical protein
LEGFRYYYKRNGMEDPTRRKETRMESGIQIEEGQRERDLQT